MFQVFDNGRPADCNNHKVHPTWNKSMYDSFEEAQQYCHQWLGEYANCTPLKPNQKINYSGWGDTIEIREVSTNMDSELMQKKLWELAEDAERDGRQ